MPAASLWILKSVKTYKDNKFKKDVRKDQGGDSLEEKLIVQLFWKDIPSPFRAQLKKVRQAP